MNRRLPLAFDLTILSAEDLTLSGHPIKKNAFITVWVDSKDDAARSTTTINHDGGSHPRWNEKMTILLPPSAQFVNVEACCKTPMGVRSVGRATIPVSDFLGEMMPEYYLHHLSYRLRDGSGRHNGIVNLTMRRSISDAEASASGFDGRFTAGAAGNVGTMERAKVPIDITQTQSSTFTASVPTISGELRRARGEQLMSPHPGKGRRRRGRDLLKCCPVCCGFRPH